MTVRYIDNADQYKKIFGWFYNNAESIDFSKSYYLEFEDADRRRSKLQNAFLWGWVYKELSSALNVAGYSLNGAPYTHAIIHAIAQANFRITDTFTNEKGQECYIYRSTADMGKKEFSEDIEKINHYFIDLYQIAIPDHRESARFSRMATEVGL